MEWFTTRYQNTYLARCCCRSSWRCYRRSVSYTHLAAADRYGYYLGCIDLTVKNGQLIECQIEAIPTKSYILDLDKEDEALSLIHILEVLATTLVVMVNLL